MSKPDRRSLKLPAPVSQIKTALHLEDNVDRPRLEEMFALFTEFNDYERRLMQAKLHEMNHRARWLPSGSLELFGIHRPTWRDS